MEVIPLYAEDLINELDKMYPERCPDAETPERMIWMRSGQRELVRNLIYKLQLQKENPDAKEIIKCV